MFRKATVGWVVAFWAGSVAWAQEPIDLGNRRELFADAFLIQRLDGAELRLHAPTEAGVALRFDRPWEGAFCGYPTVILDEGTYRLYYRGLPKAGQDGSDTEVTCYAESRDGVHWEKPNLGLFEINGTRENNVILRGQAPFSHNFSPFLDTRPGVPAQERYKALGGTQGTGLVAFVSEDGIRWTRWREEAVFREGAFDSQNVAFWSVAEGRYLLYFRVFRDGVRTVSRTTSPDFVVWSVPEPMDFGDKPMEHLYTSQTHPYFRAPHLYVALPMRFMPGRAVLTEAKSRQLGVESNYRGDCADTVFMTTRGGTRYERTFMEGFIRPGTDPGNWASRAGIAALGVVPTGPVEMSIYKQAHYAQPSAHLLRYTLRTDGFVSLHAGYSGGEMVTRPVRFRGKALLLNLSTSAAGRVRVELQNLDGTPKPGFSVEESLEIVGDDLDLLARWKNGSDVSSLDGDTLRLRFVLKDADLYSFRFR